MDSKLGSQHKLLFFTVTCIVLLFSSAHAQRHYDFKKTGFLMKLQMSNLGSFGRIAYPPYSPSPNPPVDSIGLEYPTGVEHLFGAGLWVGGKLDTARIGTGLQRKFVSVS